MKLLLVLLLVAGAAGGSADDWPQYRGSRRDGVWRERGILEFFDEAEIAARVRWRASVSNGYSGPTVAGGRVFLTDRVNEPPQERVRCFDWRTGRELWSFAYDCVYRDFDYQNGPRASVTVADGRAYALGAMGHLHCLDARSGKLLWGRDLYNEYNIRLIEWGIAAAPLVEGNWVIAMIGGANACLVAFDRKTGAERWRALDDTASYSAPIVITQARQRVLVCWTADRVVGLNPRTGELLWAQPFPRQKWPIAIAPPVWDGKRLFLSSAIDGSLLLHAPGDRLGVEQLWLRRGPNEIVTDALHSLICPPILQDDFIYGLDHYGQLRCLDARNGDRVWEELGLMPRARSAGAHITPQGDKFWIFTERGELILARLTPRRYEEISRAKLIAPTLGQYPARGGVTWSPPAYAYRHIFVRNDEELLCADLRARRR